MTTPAIEKAIERHARAVREYAFIGATDPDDHDDIEAELAYSRDLLSATIDRALKRRTTP